MERLEFKKSTRGNKTNTAYITIIYHKKKGVNQNNA